MLSNPDTFLATALFALLGTILTILLALSGLIASVVGYRAIHDRLRREEPNHPLMSYSWWSGSAGRQTIVVSYYIKRHGADANVFLAIGGLAMMIPMLYVGVRIAPFVLDLWPHVAFLGPGSV
jgi:hypothetical protein